MSLTNIFLDKTFHFQKDRKLSILSIENKQDTKLKENNYRSFTTIEPLNITDLNEKSFKPVSVLQTKHEFKIS